MKRETTFSPCRKYRYTLWREWDGDLITALANPITQPDKFVQFIGLNPSTADETLDDPTIRRCIRFAKDWGYGAICMTNLFAFRATDPDVMKVQCLPEDDGEWDKNAVMSNRDWIGHIALHSQCDLTVAAWGKHGMHRRAHVHMIAFFKGLHKPLYHLGLNDDGTPKHPLYLKADTKPTLWT